jgi:hypothetical protein
MGKLKEQQLNNLTDSEIDQIYEELINSEIIYHEDDSKG